MVLLVLGLSVPAIADVFVYNLKQGGVGFVYDESANDGEGAWVHPPTSDDTTFGHTMYLVIQVDREAETLDSIDILTIDTWKEKDTDENDKPITVKYYSVSDSDTINFVETPVAKKNTWLAEGILESSNTHVMLSGQTKSTKIGDTKYVVAATLSGYQISGDIASQDISGGTASLTLNSKFTLYVQQQMNDGEDVGTAINGYVEDVLGYEAY
jgi:hypothetical protein